MPLPQHTSTQQLANDLGQFFIKKIEEIRSELNASANLHIPQFHPVMATISQSLGSSPTMMSESW